MEFDYVMKIPKMFCNSFGLVPYFDSKITESTRKQSVTFWSSFIILGLCVIGELFYFINSDFSNFLEMTALAPCLGFVMLAMIKMMTVRANRHKLTMLMENFQKLYPTKPEEQKLYNVFKYMTDTNYKMKLYYIIFMVLIWIFNLTPYCVTLYKYHYYGNWEPMLPYFIWYPFNEYAKYIFEINYILQMWAGFVTVAGILSADLVFCATVTHLHMQFDILGKKLENLDPSIETMKENNKDLNHYVKVHDLLILLSTELEEIYAPSLLLNFTGSSLIICLVGFQATAGEDYVELFKFFLFLVSSMVQIFMLCWYGNLIIECSLGVSDSVYLGNWFNGDSKFKKSVQLILMRAQKPQTLTAYKFSVVSVQSFSTIMSTSYSYFTLLRTMYNPK